jgi:uncharacterized protein (TIGR00725 family)
MIPQLFPKDCIAVLGGGTRYAEKQVIAAFQIGREIGQRGKTLITGATTGIPYAAAIGAKSAGAFVIGVSPASDVDEHLSIYRKPISHLDAIIFTGMGLEGRNPINVRSATGAIFVGGEFGTLNEFSAACTIGDKVLGVLEAAGGISAFVPSLLQELKTHPNTDVLFDCEPVTLVRRVCDAIDTHRSSREVQSWGNELGQDVREMIAKFISSENKELHMQATHS